MKPTRKFCLFGGLLFVVFSVCYAADNSHESLKRNTVPAEGKISVSSDGIVPNERYDVRSDGAIRVTDCRGVVSCQNPAFSPDGTEIIFTRFLRGYNQGPSEIVRLKLATLSQKPVIQAGEYDHVNVPGSSWYRGVITYASDASVSGNEEIFTTDLVGEKTSQVTQHNDEAGFIEPSFSPDGTKIVFEKTVCPISDCEAKDLNRGSIWIIELSDHRLEQIAGDDRFDYRLPNWSPAGNKILFQKRNYPSDGKDEPVWDIWVVGADGSDPVNVTDSQAYDTDASWARDGRHIVYSSDYAGLEHPNIYIVSSSKGEPLRVTYSRTKEDGAPSLSPDFNFVAFESHRTSNEDSPSNIWLIENPKNVRN